MAIGAFIKARRLIKEAHFDLVEFYGDQYWLLLIWAKFIFKKKNLLFVAHVDGIELHDMDKEQQYWSPRKGLKKWLYRNTHYRMARITFGLADKYICGCKDDLNYVIDHKIFKPTDAVCIPPGIDNLYHELPFIEEKDPVIVFLGSWIERKGVRIIPGIISEILREHPGYSFHIYGSWSLKNEILSSFPEQIREKIFVFEKLPIQSLRDGILKSAIFFFPSYSEGFGLATVEAMGCSCAVVTTRTGVGSELTDGTHAMLCDFDDTQAMKESIGSLIRDPWLREAIAYNGYLKSKSFNWEKQVELLNLTYCHWVLDKGAGKQTVSDSIYRKQVRVSGETKLFIDQGFVERGNRINSDN